MSKKETLTEADLRQFTGTEHWHRHGLIRHMLFTDGAKCVADRCEAYWLLDEIVFAQPGIDGGDFQAWTLAVNADRSGTLTCEDGNGNTLSVRRIPYTDFPLAEITLWFANNTIYLPSEH